MADFETKRLTHVARHMLTPGDKGGKVPNITDMGPEDWIQFRKQTEDWWHKEGKKGADQAMQSWGTAEDAERTCDWVCENLQEILISIKGYRHRLVREREALRMTEGACQLRLINSILRQSTNNGGRATNNIRKLCRHLEGKVVKNCG